MLYKSVGVASAWAHRLKNVEGSKCRVTVALRLFLRAEVIHFILRVGATAAGRLSHRLFSVAIFLQLGADLRQEDPPNLNILLSGGKETNKDSPSNGE